MKKLIFILFLISSSYALAESHLPECQGDDVTKFNKCFAEVSFNNGDVYAGDWKNGKSHGKGTYFDAMLGTVTKGKWEEDFFVVGSN